jgi:hypothetical protein
MVDILSQKKKYSNSKDVKRDNEPLLMECMTKENSTWTMICSIINLFQKGMLRPSIPVIVGPWGAERRGSKMRPAICRQHDSIP